MPWAPLLNAGLAELCAHRGHAWLGPIITYNNVFQSGRDVFVPQYGIAPLDAAALVIYRDLGRRAVAIPGCEASGHRPVTFRISLLRVI